VRFSDIVEFFIRRMLNNDLREVLANIDWMSEDYQLDMDSGMRTE